MKKSSVLSFALEASAIYRAWFLISQKISRFYLLLSGDLSNWNWYHSFSTCLHFFYISKILGSLSKGCTLIEYIELNVIAIENPLFSELSALSSLRRLRSVFINMQIDHDSPSISSEDSEHFRVSLDAIVEQGLLEVSIFQRCERPIIFSQVTSYLFAIHPLVRSPATFLP